MKSCTFSKIFFFLYFSNSKKRCKEQVELVRAVYQSSELLIPEPGKEVRLTFDEGQKTPS